MTNQDFGKLALSYCYKAMMANDILADIERGNAPCDAVRGFVDAVRLKQIKSNADLIFLQAYDKALEAK